MIKITAYSCATLIIQIIELRLYHELNKKDRIPGRIEYKFMKSLGNLFELLDTENLVLLTT